MLIKTGYPNVRHCHDFLCYKLLMSLRMVFVWQVWLGDLANEMKDTLKQLLIDCLNASKKGGSGGGVDPSKFPSQVRFTGRRCTFIYHRRVWIVQWERCYDLKICIANNLLQSRSVHGCFAEVDGCNIVVLTGERYESRIFFCMYCRITIVAFKFDEFWGENGKL